ncbi:MAG: helix-turn-helix transcriptional regulator [Mucilaginibacter sp.]|uniref:helix-turn-helix domain-containing protein n=2 Tax=Mucilaginibacter sp. TaxID=1882438 RepID=UPI003263F940
MYSRLYDNYQSPVNETMKNLLNFKVKAVAANIRSKREELNYTQEYLAAKLNISQNAYSKIELGYTKITLERLFQIADVLETELMELIKTENAEAA